MDHGFSKQLLASVFSNHLSQVLPHPSLKRNQLYENSRTVALEVSAGKVKRLFFCTSEHGMLKICWCFISKMGHWDALMLRIFDLERYGTGVVILAAVCSLTRAFSGLKSRL